MLQDYSKNQCYECSSTFISVKKLHIHMESVHYGQSFACDECDEIFTRKDSLHRHRVTSHRGENFGGKFECEECEGTFTRKEGLTRHKVVVHANQDEEKFECRDCREEFSSVTRTRGAWLLSSGGATSTSTCFSFCTVSRPVLLPSLTSNSTTQSL